MRVLLMLLTFLSFNTAFATCEEAEKLVKPFSQSIGEVIGFEFARSMILSGLTKKQAQKVLDTFNRRAAESKSFPHQEAPQKIKNEYNTNAKRVLKALGCE